MRPHDPLPSKVTNAVHTPLKGSFVASRKQNLLGPQRTRSLRRHIKLGLPLFVCMRFQVLFHSPPGVLFAFPSRYWCAIGRLRVFSLGGWSPNLQTGFHVSRPTCRIPSSTACLSLTGLSPTMAGFSMTVLLDTQLKDAGCSDFARHYSRN